MSFDRNMVTKYIVFPNIKAQETALLQMPNYHEYN